MRHWEVSRQPALAGPALGVIVTFTPLKLEASLGLRRFVVAYRPRVIL